jgi:hypothetical protein
MRFFRLANMLPVCVSAAAFFLEKVYPVAFGLVDRRG